MSEQQPVAIEEVTVFTDKPIGVPQEPLTSLEDWVGEGKKFASIEDLAKSYGHSQAHIQTVERSYAELRADLEKREAIEEVLNRLQADRAPQSTQQHPVEESYGRDSKALSREEIARLIDERAGEQVSSFAEQVKGDQNEAIVSEQLSKRFGSREAAQKLLSEKAAKLDMSLDEFRQLARTRPYMILEMFPSSYSPDSPSTMPNLKSEVRTEDSRFNSGNVGRKNFAYYERLRRESQSEYFRPAVQLEMMEQARAMGQDFYK